MTTGRIFRPFDVGRFTIIPEGETPPEGCGIPLVMGRKGAFGSGEHETTAACLDQLQKLETLKGARMLDLGSGTGILAIAGVLLGGESAIAIDIEWPAAVSCSSNIRLNGVAGKILTVCGELACLADSRFDLVMANIYADILMPLADRLVELTSPRGYILLSGIPMQDKYDIWRRYTDLGCREADSRIGEDYVTYLLEKSPAPEGS